MRLPARRSVRVLLAGFAAVQFACGSNSPVAPASQGKPAAWVNAAPGGVSAKNVPPTLVLRTVPAMNGNTISGGAPLSVRFNACPSSDADRDDLNWQFNFGDSGRPAFNPDGTFNPDIDHICRVDHVYEREGTYTATVSVTDKHLEDQGRGVGSLARSSQQVIVQVSGKGEKGCGTLAVSTDFEGFPFFTFAETLGLPGVTLNGGGAFVVLPVPFFTSLDQNALITPSGPNLLTITWAGDQSAASFQFATNGPGTLTLAGFSGTGAPLFSAPFTGTIRPSGFPEGTAAVTGIFRSLVITGTTEFAIDYLNSSPFCP